MSAEMVKEFFYAISYACGMNLHIKVLAGGNNHHVAEAMFKSFAKALTQPHPMIQGSQMFCLPRAVCKFENLRNDLWQSINQMETENGKYSEFKSSIAWSDFKLNSDGMVPVIAQDYQTNEVLMLAYMNEKHLIPLLKQVK